MSILRRQKPSPQDLQIRMRYHGLHQHFAQAFTPIFFQNKNVAQVCKGRAIAYHPGKPDLLFVVVNLARKFDVEPETALKKTNRKFRKRFGFVERELKSQGKLPEESNLEEMDALWNRSKL